ncbi:hypothetical protein [Myxosarcina sp. GI1]|uniref:hypothetical protein n=1 Tax=Myxosarcina sp. GI1 TaxID=1541065 RepID=UPI000560ED50|nr:hypothetical protein [Myxosarcina sp. GI1]
MLRHILQDLEWGITLAIATLILFLIIAHLTTAPAIATITETNDSSQRMARSSCQKSGVQTTSLWFSTCLLITNH